MKNCPNGCETVTEKKHCKSKGCLWYICVPCKIVFDPEHIERKMPLVESAK